MQTSPAESEKEITDETRLEILKRFRESIWRMHEEAQSLPEYERKDQLRKTKICNGLANSIEEICTMITGSHKRIRQSEVLKRANESLLKGPFEIETK